MAITLTENAVKQIRTQLAKRGKGLGLRVGIRKVGCSGFAYTFDYADEIGADDLTFGDSDAAVVVDRESATALEGAQLDFVREGLKQMFKFDNPNVDSTCGCGESFNFKETAKS